MGRLLLFLCCSVGVLAGKAQMDVHYSYPDSFPSSEHHDEITLLTGYHQGRYGFAELGIGRDIYGSNHHPYGVGYDLGAEVRVDRPELWGVKAGAYVTSGFAMGVQYIHYMEGANSMEVLRPEIGIGLFKFKMTYAYNLRITKPRMDGINTHMLSLSYAFRLKRLPSTRLL